MILFTALDIFEKVNLKRPMEQRRFFNALNDTLDELRATYYDIEILVNGEKEPGRTGRLTDVIDGIDLYVGAIVDNINFLNGGDETDKGEFVRKAELAHAADRRKKNKVRRIKRLGW